VEALMHEDRDPTVPVLTLGIATAPRTGELHSGDRYVVRSLKGGNLLAVIDGQGHGERAAHSAELATSLIERFAGEPLSTLATLVHLGLRHERGAALSLAWVDRREETLTWLGIGSAQGVLLHADPHTKPPMRSLLVRAGTIGDRLPQLEPTKLPLAHGDTLLFTTDGIDAGYREALPKLRELAPDQLAARILADHGRSDDDALVLVARYAGGDA
jgi:serine phosphatase RsbU (regulator of sigma subunit)